MQDAGATLGVQGLRDVSRSPETGTGKAQALELVVMRGKDVVGVRHILDGRAHVGVDAQAIAKVPAARSEVIAEVVGGRFTLFVPAGTRARLHQADGLARLLRGPAEVTLVKGDRAVLVLGTLQIRAQIVPVEVAPRTAPVASLSARAGGAGRMGERRAPGMLSWVAMAGTLYAAALAICVIFAPRERLQLDAGTVGRAVTAATATATTPQSSRLASSKPVVEGMKLPAAQQLDLHGRTSSLGQPVLFDAPGLH